MKRNFELMICLFFIGFSILSYTVSSETGEDYWPKNNPSDGRYWDIVRWDELLSVEKNGNVNITVRILLEFYNLTSDSWIISFDLGPNVTKPVLHENNHSNFIDEKNFTSGKYGTILTIEFNSSINTVYKWFSLRFSYQVEAPSIVEKVSEPWEMTNRFRLNNPASFFSNFNPGSINYYIALPSRASLHRHNVDIDENEIINPTEFQLTYHYLDAPYFDYDRSFIKLPDVEDYYICKISETSEEDPFPDNKILIEYTTPNEIIGPLIIVAAVFSILGFIVVIYKRIIKLISFLKMENFWKRVHWKKYRKLFFLIGVIGLAIGVFFMVLGVVTDNKDNVRDAAILASMGVAVISLGIASHSVIVANRSDEKMKTIANSSFLEALNDFEQTRVKFIGPSPRYSVQLFIWRSRTILERVHEYDKDIIKPEHQKRLVNFFVVSLRELFARHTWNSLQTRKQTDVIKMYTIAREYQRDPNDWEELISHLETYMGKRSDEDESDFFNRISLTH